mgnify:CR=1 FL=1
MTAVDSANKAKARAAFLDFLRILAAFLVIVNHTNSYVFKTLTPVDSQWHWSILWYYVSKTAVPLFIMISGACLLGKRAAAFCGRCWRWCWLPICISCGTHG